MKHYRFWLFDCDGVLLNSNKVKSDAFGMAVAGYGGEAARLFVEYHKLHGGVSRQRKFDYFFSDILKRRPKSGEVEELLKSYADFCVRGLLESECTDGLEEVLSTICDSNAVSYVVTGGLETEVRYILDEKGLLKYFDAVLGNPRDKLELVQQLVGNGCDPKESVFLGDSKYDYMVASEFDIDFVFLSRWTEFANWVDFFRGKRVTVCDDVAGYFWS